MILAIFDPQVAQILPTRSFGSGEEAQNSF